jgi:hypothetical protein
MLDQLRDTIALRDNEVMKRLTNVTIQQTDGMCDLTERSIRDARTVKTITLVTLIYLPASFTSVSIPQPTRVSLLPETNLNRPSWEWGLSMSMPQIVLYTLMLATTCGSTSL